MVQPLKKSCAKTIEIFKINIFAALEALEFPGLFIAQMAELVDALVSGTSVCKYVQVRVLFWAQSGHFQGGARLQGRPVQPNIKKELSANWPYVLY